MNVLRAVFALFLVWGFLILSLTLCHDAHAQVANPDVTEATKPQTICAAGWTKKVRPPESYTNPIKRRMLTEHPELHAGDHQPAHYELDHYWAEEVGGHPRDPGNLRPQPYATAFGAEAKQCSPKEYGYTAECKDIVETSLHRSLCPRRGAAKLSIQEAQQLLLDENWVGELTRRFPKYAGKAAGPLVGGVPWH